jgi:hypothetical protein
MRRRLIRGLLLGAIASVALYGLKAEGEVRKDEIECENAIQHMQDCCGADSGRDVDCTYVYGGCEAPDKPPELSIAQSQCLQTLTCADVQLMGGCGSFLELCR